ncbi:MAG: hypothetical protein R6U98_03665 [Pirellulaceae bacterium]
MVVNWSEEEFIERRVTYMLETAGSFIVVENVPARVSMRTGERFFAPETVERLQKILWQSKQPARVVETPVFEFSQSLA